MVKEKTAKSHICHKRLYNNSIRPSVTRYNMKNACSIGVKMEFEVNFSVNVIGYGFVRLTEVSDCCSRGRVCKIFFFYGPIANTEI